ncbi:hypothetical protein ACLOJK_004063, partial [Asimina triloba]
MLAVEIRWRRDLVGRADHDPIDVSQMVSSTAELALDLDQDAFDSVLLMDGLMLLPAAWGCRMEAKRHRLSARF